MSLKWDDLNASEQQMVRHNADQLDAVLREDLDPEEALKSAKYVRLLHLFSIDAGTRLNIYVNKEQKDDIYFGDDNLPLDPDQLMIGISWKDPNNDDGVCAVASMKEFSSMSVMNDPQDTPVETGNELHDKVFSWLLGLMYYPEGDGFKPYSTEESGFQRNRKRIDELAPEFGREFEAAIYYLLRAARDKNHKVTDESILSKLGQLLKE